MRYHWLIPLIAALANLVVFVPILRQGIRRPLHRAFAAMTLVIVLWNLDIFSLYYFPDALSAELWSRFFRSAIFFTAPTVVQFALVLSGTTGRVWRAVLGLAYVTAILLAIANLQGLLVDRLTPHVWGWYVVPTRLYAVFPATLLVFFLLAGERIWHTYRYSASPRQRAQAKFWLVAAGTAMPLSLVNFLPAYGVRVYPIGNLGNVVYVWLLAYAIVRHRLMDVDYVVRKVVSFSLASVVVFLPGGTALTVLTRAIGLEEPLLVVVPAIALGLVAVILIPTLQHALETQVQRALFPQTYDYRRRLRQLASDLGHVLNEARLVAQLGDALSEILEVESCEVFVRDESTQRLTRVYPTGPGGGEPFPETQLPEPFTGPILASELESQESPAAAFFRARGWEAAVPLRIDQRGTGFFALGRNKDFRLFSGEDLQLLAAVAGAASVALENASLSRQLRHSEIVLERANRLSSIGMLAAGIAHEIRNPLVAVKTFLDLLPQRLDDREFLTHFRDLSLGELRRVTDLIADLLALGKSKTAERRRIDLGPTLEPVVRLMESTARKREVEVAASFGDALPPVYADPDQLKQIILNLILNAVDSSAPGAHVTLDVRPGLPDGVVLEVRDEGGGIPPEQLETIFHPFFTTKETGTGLGLTLVHQMVVEHGGQITVESEVGRGSVFRVTLPSAAPELAQTGT